jgi:hypothetical protein
MAHLYSITSSEPYREEEVVCLIRQAIALYEMKDTQGAKAILKKITVALPPVAKAATAFGSKNRLAMIKVNVGILESELGGLENGIKLMDEGIRLQRELAADGSSGPRHQLGQSLQLRGKVYGNNKMKELAIRDLDESIALFKKLIAEGRRSVQAELDRSLRHRREAELGQPLRNLP